MPAHAPILPPPPGRRYAGEQSSFLSNLEDTAPSPSPTPTRNREPDQSTAAPPRPPVVLIAKRDRAAAAAIAREAAAAWPGAHVIVEHRLADAAARLAAGGLDWLVTGLSFDDGDALGLIGEATALGTPAVLVHTGRCSPRALAWLLPSPVRGIFESQAEPAGRLPAVLRTVAQGTRYFGEGVRWARQHREESGLGVIAELTTTEQVALALLASARGPRETAGLLAMAEDGLRDVVRRLHARLGVQDQAQLISAALRLGFVRAAPHGLAAVGLPLLCNARLTRHHNPAPCSG